jgi:hypothetical protein
VTGLGQLRAGATRHSSQRAASADRRGLADVISLRALAPHAWRVQVGAWAAAAVRGRGDVAFAGAGEARVRLSGSLFLGAELSRLVRRERGDLAPLWIASAWLGAVVGDPRP